MRDDHFISMEESLESVESFEAKIAQADADFANGPRENAKKQCADESGDGDLQFVRELYDQATGVAKLREIGRVHRLGPTSVYVEIRNNELHWRYFSIYQLLSNSAKFPLIEFPNTNNAKVIIGYEGHKDAHIRQAVAAAKQYLAEPTF